MLRADDESLSGLETNAPLLLPGLRLVRRLGRGGMSTVFLGRVEAASDALHHDAPPDVAIKLVQAATMRQLARLGVDPHEFVHKEVLAFRKVKGRTPNVVGFYGDGSVSVEISGEVFVLPWLALELLGGASLEDRVAEGMDVARARSLIRGVCAGVEALHEVSVIHRDIKPANVLVADTPDGEVAKLSDCGIARLLGVQMATIAAASVRYAAPEQMASVTSESNPLIGAWTDVHALAALVWYVLGGCDWYEVSDGWERGMRASLRLAPALLRRVREDAALLDRLDAVLARGASMRVPAGVLESAPPSMAAIVYQRSIAAFAGPPRHASVREFAAELMPLLDEACGSRIAPSPMADTFFAGALEQPTAQSLDVEEWPAPHSDEPVVDGAAMVQADGKVLARNGPRLVYFIDGKPNTVTLLRELVPLIARTRWILPGPGGGFALCGPQHVILFSKGRPTNVALPAGAGPILAAACDGAVLTVVTGDVPDTDGPQIFRTRDGARWEAPERLDAMNGVVRSVAHVSGGLIAVGASASGRYPRAVAALDDGRRRVFGAALADEGALEVVAASGDRVWAFGAGVAVRFDVATATMHREALPDLATPRAAVVDAAGEPWVVTDHAVLRRSPRFQPVYKHRGAPLVAIGHTPRGVVVVDAAGARVRLSPGEHAGTAPTRLG